MAGWAAGSWWTRIADLLDPTAEHGQGASFLEAMLDALPETRGRFGTLDSTAAATGAWSNWARSTGTTGASCWSTCLPSTASPRRPLFRRWTAIAGGNTSRSSRIPEGIRFSTTGSRRWHGNTSHATGIGARPVPELHEECDAGGGPITDFRVDGLLRIAPDAIPAINEVETTERAAGGE